MSFSDVDRGYKALFKRLSAPAVTMTVGVHGDAGPVADVATYNEFGTDRIPERSFIRAWADANAAGIKEALRAVERAVIAGKYTRDVGMQRLGLLFVGQIQARISAGVPPPNAESTIASKGSSKPLINTGQLRAAITSRVT